jgi:epidermal growth factor receptor substrate 15
LPGHDALPFLTSSGLPPQTLGEVWAIADPENNGFLTREGWYKAARVIGWLQKGNKTQVDNSLVSKPGPLPTFKGYPSPPAASQGPLSANVTGSGLPPLTASDRTNFTRIFVSCGPSNGFVNGDKARDVFLKSQLNYDKLGLIW